MSTRVALRYAKAILDLAKENKAETEVNTDLIAIAETIKQSDDLQTLLKSPIIKIADKIACLDKLFGASINTFTKGLLHLLAENNRLDMLAEVAIQYAIIYDFLKSIEVARVTTAVAITPAIEAKVKAKIKELTGNESTIENVVNPDIIGGFILRVGDIEYNASIANNFRTLERSFDNSHYEAKI